MAKKRVTIIDLYTDEPAGLGVPPYLGTYPRYIAGAFLKDKCDVFYLTIDDIRYCYQYNSNVPETKLSGKTEVKIKHLTKNKENVKKILESSDEIIVSGGAHTSGKYLSAIPGTLKEIVSVIQNLNCRKVLAGPLASQFGSAFHGGKHVRKSIGDFEIFDEVDYFYKGIDDYSKVAEFAVFGAHIVKQIPYPIIVELETSSGCSRRPGCSFCTEPLKGCQTFREQVDIVKETRKLSNLGINMFRLGKQSCFYSYKSGKAAETEKFLKQIYVLKPKILHIDNANPAKVITDEGKKMTKLILKYCTEGNVAAFGVESFDVNVVKQNNLNSDPETTFEAVRELNRTGKERGMNGMPRFLPGINILLGLKGETKSTLQKNLDGLKQIYDESLMLRRINIRQVVPYLGTDLYKTAGDKFIKKNKRHYYSFRKKIREQIDYPMLQRLLPPGTLLKEVYTEIWDGKTTFGRQFGTYPLIIGIQERLPLEKYINVRVKSHMLRSVVGEKV